MKKSILFLLVGLLSNGWLFANHWTPDDAQYEDNMTLTGVISVNGVEQQSTSLEVGVFCGEECRGSGLPTYFFPTQRYVVQLTIFGEVGDQLTFKLYDHALGQELDLVMPNAVAFAANGYGSLQEPFVLDFAGSVAETYTISVSTNPAEGGTVEGAGDYVEGQTCTLVATANEGYAFLNWTENGTEISGSPTYSFAVTSSRNLVANFVSSDVGAHWIPNEEAYEDNTTLTGVIQINGVEQQSNTLEVGVFCGEECRGSGMPTYFFPTQRYVVQLTIFGENGDQLTFKLYDHAIGQELNLTPPESVTFVANGYGSLSDPYVLVFSGEEPSVFHFIITGNWSEASNWEGGVLPGVFDEVFIDAPCQLDQNATVAKLTVSDGQSLTLQSGQNLTVTNVLTNEATTGLVIEDGAQLMHASENVSATVKKNIEGHGTSKGKYSLISNPLTSIVDPEISSVYHLIRGNYDLYDWLASTPDSLEWRNFKDNTFLISPEGYGYLYANQNGVELTFPGILRPSKYRFGKSVTYDSNDIKHPGWNLIGNPFVCDAYLVDEDNEPLPFYRMNAAGNGFEADTAGAIAPMEGVFYQASENGTVYFVRMDTTMMLTTYTINVTVNPTEGGTVAGGGTYIEGQTCTVMATPNANFTFANWMENGELVSTDATYTFIVNADRTLVASFSRIVPTGAINGLFSVSASRQVYFSRGNLQYKASTNTWRFAPHQYDVIGSSNSSSCYSTSYSWIDLFGWGTSGYNHGATCYQPWSHTNRTYDYYAYGNSAYNLYDGNGRADWGYNPISNGGNVANKWRTLTKAEWNYVFNTRSTTSGVRYAMAQVNNVNGVILLPDNWSTSTYSLSGTNSYYTSFSSNTLSTSQWSVLEQAGAVFLPVTGYRHELTVKSLGNGYYWSSKYYDGNYAYYLFIGSGSINASSNEGRCEGFSVRLVCPCQ